MTRVLVAEDSPTQAEELRLILESEGFEVEVVGDGQQALERLAATPFSVVVSDIIMPRLSGYELCRAMKDGPATMDTPIILVTTLSDPLDIIQGLECGADNFITKPYDAAQLVGRIRGLLDTKRMRAEGKLRVGVEILFLGKKFTIGSGREQILDLLVSTFEDIVKTNRELRVREGELAEANAKVERYVQQLEDRARTSEEHFRTLVESMDDVVFTLDLEQRFTGSFGGLGSDGAQPQRGQLGMTARALFTAETAALHEAANERALAGERVQYEWSVEGADGTRHFHTSLAPLRGAGGGVEGLVGVSRELTAEKKLQAQLMVSDRMASVGTLAAGVAHEINNPLASVMANLDLALHELASRAHGEGLEELIEALRDARDAAEKVRQIVRDLRIFSRAEEERLGPVDVERTLESSLRMAWNEIRHRARLVKNFGRVPAVEANESRLGQVFLNIIVNAAQALPLGRAQEHEVRVTTRVGPEGKVVVEIADTGPGIPPEVFRHLFTPFFTTKPPGVGTGLGLAICHRLVTSFGGQIHVDTKPGQGTTFSITLPLASASAERSTPTPTPSFGEPTRRGRVLIIDDEQMITQTVRRTLAPEHEVTTANSAREALGLMAGGHHFDAILCDLMMPEMTGMDLHAELARTAPEQAARMIFLTGGAFTPKARAFLDATPNQRLEKPFDTMHLRAIVNERLR